MGIIEKVFSPLYDKPCWNVKQGYGSFLTFEFGKPHLEIHEPEPNSAKVSGNKINHGIRRNIFVHGDWHLWLYFCEWTIHHNGQELANNKFRRQIIKNALFEIDGQILSKVTVQKSLKTIFNFDLGGKIEVYPYKSSTNNSDCWLLYEPDGKVFVLRTDGYYSHEMHNMSESKIKWSVLK